MMQRSLLCKTARSFLPKSARRYLPDQKKNDEGCVTVQVGCRTVSSAKRENDCTLEELQDLANTDWQEPGHY